MAEICPTVTAESTVEYRAQIKRIKPFTKRVHIDLMDGDFAPSKSVGLENISWPHEFSVDLHLMYQLPMDYLDIIKKLKPHMVIIHAEADVNHMLMAAELHKANIKAGLCALQETSVGSIEQILHSFDHFLIFSGKLGYFGGDADPSLGQKITQAKEHHQDLEIGWDGGINNQNANLLADAGVDVLNVGGFIQLSSEPAFAYATLMREIEG